MKEGEVEETQPRSAKGLDAEVERSLARLRRLAGLFDSAFGIPGTRFRIGWDGIVGLIPGVGDAIGLAPLAYYFLLVRRHRLGFSVYPRLLANQGIDFLVGAIPVLGDLFDLSFKANLRNARLLEDLIRGARR